MNLSCLACVYFTELNEPCRKGFETYNGYSSIDCGFFELSEPFKKLGEKRGGGE